MTREEINRELAERARVPVPLPPDGLCAKEEQAWLLQRIAERRRELGITNLNGAFQPTSRPRPA